MPLDFTKTLAVGISTTALLDVGGLKPSKSASRCDLLRCL